MNRFMNEQYPTFKLYQSLRDQLMDALTDEDLQFNPGGENPTLGTLCREIGEVEQSYIDSLKNLKQDFSYRNDDPGLENSVSRLSDWFKTLDSELLATLESLTDEQLQNQVIDRGGGFKLPVGIQIDVYKEALLIFYGKADVYLKAMGKPRPEQWQDWIA